MLRFNLPLFSRPISLSVCLAILACPPALLCEITCESDQLNPDHQLCLTYFRFGTLGFLAFAFVYMGLAWTHDTCMRFDLPAFNTMPTKCFYFAIKSFLISLLKPLLLMCLAQV